MDDGGSADGGGADGLKNSHYEILGVGESADRRSIRAAYLKKIKANHPDRARRAKSASDRAAAINLAYFVLRDSRRRLAYDLDLRRVRNGGAAGAGGPVGLWRPRALSGGAKPPPPRSGKAIASGLLVGAAIVGLIVLIVDLEPAARPLPVPVAAADSAIPAEPDASPWVDRAMVDRAVETLMVIRARGQSSDALAYSRNCFAELAEAPTTLLLDHCLAFDVAAANWRRGADVPAETDFAPQAMAPRHAAALRRATLAGGGRDRLREVNLATFAALARRLRPAEPENLFSAASNYADAVEDAASGR